MSKCGENWQEMVNHVIAVRFRIESKIRDKPFMKLNLNTPKQSPIAVEFFVLSKTVSFY